MTSKKQEKEHKIGLETENKELIETLKRLQAEFENYQKRTEKEKQDLINLGNEKLVTKLLDILDNFERALTHIKDEGITLIYTQLKTLLEKDGLKEINSIDQKFNVNLHEAITKIASEKEENTILEVHQKGYVINNKVIRHAKVIISGGKEDE